MLTVLAALVALTQDPAAAESLPCPEPLSALGDLAMSQCLDQAWRWEEERMLRYVRGTVSAIHMRTLADPAASLTQAEGYVEAGQAAWSAYAEIECQSVAEAQGPGTLSALALKSCMIDLMRERSETLWRNHYLDDVSAGPGLPEPALTVREEKLRAGPEMIRNPGSLPYGE